MSLWSRIANVFRGDRLSREIDEELESHIQEAIAQGRDPVEAQDVGLHGVGDYSVLQRRREIGIRLANRRATQRYCAACDCRGVRLGADWSGRGLGAAHDVGAVHRGLAVWSEGQRCNDAGGTVCDGSGSVIVGRVAGCNPGGADDPVKMLRDE